MQAPVTIVANLGIISCSIGSFIESPTSQQELAVYNRGNSSLKTKKSKLHQIESLGGNSGAGMVGDSSGAAGWSSSFGSQGSSTA